MFLLAHVAFAQLVVDSTQTPDNFVLYQLGGPGVTTSNVTWSGDTNQFAGFDGTACNIGLSHGLVIATGNAALAMGPNDSGSATFGGGNYEGSDPDLQTLATQTVNDAAFLEFDVVPTFDSLRITLVFASEEYLEFVNSINDVMGVFLSGPGISGPFSNNAINMAVVPLNGYAVSVNQINNVVNPELYIDNGDGYTAPFNADSTYVQYDGFTVPLTFAWAVQPGMTYHVKVAIADASDTAWDSAVFLATGSLTAQSLLVTGMEELPGASPFRMQPNPANGRAVVTGLSASGTSHLEVLDARGGAVRERAVQGPSASMDLAGLAPGIYLLRVTDAGGAVRTERITVGR
jgi:hypothetical protein